MRIASMLMMTLLAGVALAADVTGKWNATMPGRDGQTREVVYNLKAEGDKLTGTTTGFRGQELPLVDGKIDGDNLSFSTKMEFNGNSMTMLYTGKVSGDEIKFSMKREGGEQPAREFTAKRAK